jgi:FkbM family methyltransferase
VKQLLKRAARYLASLGGQQLISKAHRCTMEQVLEQARRNGVAPRTLIDVGVAWGTQELYEAFPQAKVLLIEPNAAWEPTLQRICQARGGSYVVAAAGSEVGKTKLHVRADDPGGSSTAPAGHDGYPIACIREVDVLSIDSIVLTQQAEPPFVLKIDTQGGELDILRGAAQTLPQCELLLLEATLFTRDTNFSSFADLVSCLASHGFVVYDFYEPKYRPFDRALNQVDRSHA